MDDGQGSVASRIVPQLPWHIDATVASQNDPSACRRRAAPRRRRHPDRRFREYLPSDRERPKLRSPLFATTRDPNRTPVHNPRSRTSRRTGPVTEWVGRQPSGNGMRSREASDLCRHGSAVGSTVGEVGQAHGRGVLAERHRSGSRGPFLALLGPICSIRSRSVSARALGSPDRWVTIDAVASMRSTCRSDPIQTAAPSDRRVMIRGCRGRLRSVPVRWDVSRRCTAIGNPLAAELAWPQPVRYRCE